MGSSEKEVTEEGVSYPKPKKSNPDLTCEIEPFFLERSHWVIISLGEPCLSRAAQSLISNSPLLSSACSIRSAARLRSGQLRALRGSMEQHCHVALTFFAFAS